VEKGDICWVNYLLVKPKPIIFGVSLKHDRPNIMHHDNYGKRLTLRVCETVRALCVSSSFEERREREREANTIHNYFITHISSIWKVGLSTGGL